MSEFISSVTMCSGTGLNSAYEHTIYFSSRANQLSYFNGKKSREYTQYSWLRKNKSIKVNASFEQARLWDYLFMNNGFGDTFYFINDVQYINDATVEVFIELDVLQTYMFDWELLPCFVERQHVSNDTPGLHTVEENLELGEFTCIAEQSLVGSVYCLLVLATFDPAKTDKDKTETVLAGKFDKVFSGLGVYAVSSTDFTAWGEKLTELDEAGKSDGIISMWMYPADLVQLEDGESWTSGITHKVKGSRDDLYLYLSSETTLDNGYAPRNKKLLTYPYNFIYLTNNSGGAATYKYERFGDENTCGFRVRGSISPEGQARVYPLNYNGLSHEYESGLTLGGFPTCAWNQDLYKLWLANNQNQHNLAMASGVIQIGAGIAGAFLTGGIGALAGAGTAISGASQIASLMAQKSDMEVQPPQSKGSTSGNVNMTAGFQNFTFKKKCVDENHAKLIDSYFDMYGYRLNAVKVPEIHVRENWTYVKTIGCHIKGSFAVEDQKKIESIFNNGVTWWVNNGNMFNYTASNNPV